LRSLNINFRYLSFPNNRNKIKTLSLRVYRHSLREEIHDIIALSYFFLTIYYSLQRSSLFWTFFTRRKITSRKIVNFPNKLISDVLAIFYLNSPKNLFTSHINDPFFSVKEDLCLFFSSSILKEKIRKSIGELSHFMSDRVPSCLFKIWYFSYARFEVVRAISLRWNVCFCRVSVAKTMWVIKHRSGVRPILVNFIYN
jgi:hypothetical protein